MVDVSGTKQCVCVCHVCFRDLVTYFLSGSFLSAVGGAYNLAQSLVKFPQECMLADRRSALNAALSANSLQEALKFEHDNGVPIVAKVSTIYA